MHSSYPALFYQPPVQYNFNSVPSKKVKQELIEEPAQVEDNEVVTSSESTHPFKVLAEELETPRESLAFLNLFQKSAEKVEKLSSSLKTISILIGIVALVCFVVAFFSFFQVYFVG